VTPYYSDETAAALEDLGYALDILADEVPGNHFDATHAEQVRMEQVYRHAAQLAYQRAERGRPEDGDAIPQWEREFLARQRPPEPASPGLGRVYSEPDDLPTDAAVYPLRLGMRKDDLR
jgi:hypothetical protein